MWICCRFLSLSLIIVMLIVRTIPSIEAAPPPLSFPSRPADKSTEETETTKPECPKGQRFFNGRCRRIYTTSSSSSALSRQIPSNYDIIEDSLEKDDDRVEKFLSEQKSKHPFKKSLKHAQQLNQYNK
ncbi:hypothetical protein C0J52_03270 [Blattella germanica]|nr:hypothetical protein C0J52_03270 [Blattella germanica]